MAFIEGQAFENVVTKELVSYIPKNKIAVLHHEDLDMVAAHSLVEKKVKAVINYKNSMTGKYEHNGVLHLIRSGIPVFDIVQIVKPCHLNEKNIRLQNNGLFVKRVNRWIEVAKVKSYDLETVKSLKQKAKGEFPQRFTQFVKNTLYYAEKELQDLTKRQELFSWLQGENVLIVVRGTDYEKDLRACWPKLKRKKVKVIAVDGAADWLMQFGMKVDAIVGDMDSVSNDALCKCPRLYVHSYKNGYSPGAERLIQLNLPYKTIPFVGTSEDIALLFTFWSGAKNIFIIGSHTSMNEFLEKGRSGMGSSILVRMQANHKIIDLKGYHKLASENSIVWKYTAIPITLSFLFFSFNISKLKIFFSILWQWL